MTMFDAILIVAAGVTLIWVPLVGLIVLSCATLVQATATVALYCSCAYPVVLWLVGIGNDVTHARRSDE